jgi:hypothetical protein
MEEALLDRRNEVFYRSHFLAKFHAHARVEEGKESMGGLLDSQQ